MRKIIISLLFISSPAWADQAKMTEQINKVFDENVSKMTQASPLAKEIIESEAAYEKYRQEMVKQGIKPKPDYMSDMLKKMDKVFVEAQENERLKKIYFENKLKGAN